MQINDVIAAFLAYCSRRRSPATLAFYRARLKKFCEAYNSRGDTWDCCRLSLEGTRTAI